MFDFIFRKLGVESFRTKNIYKHAGASFFYKGGTVLANFMLVPLSIDYLNNEQYGIWLTLSSFIAWFSFFDIGLGNGLRNKFAEAKARGENKLAQAYVSTTYYTIGCISLIALVSFLLLNQLVDWSVVFNTKSELRDELNILLPVVFSFFCIQLVVKLITTIYQADQHHSIQGKIQFFAQALSLFIIWILTKTDGSSLLIFGTLFSVLPVVILFCFNLIAFNTTYKNFKPKFEFWKRKYLKEITGLGFNFFVIQIAAIILFSTDNFIISQLFGPEEVVPYNVSFKYFSIIIMVYSIIISPYWSSFTEAFTTGDYEWIKNSVNTIQKYWLLIPLILIGMVFISDWFYYLWLGDKVKVPLDLSIIMAVYALLTTFNMIYVNFINGVGKIKIQLITALLSIIINIPLSIYLAKYLELGSTGVILATCFCLGYSVILRPLQYYKIINMKAEGIWAK